MEIFKFHFPTVEGLKFFETLMNVKSPRITLEEISGVMNEIKTNKAPGTDRLTGGIIRELFQHNGMTLYDVFNEVLSVSRNLEGGKSCYYSKEK